jgi:hypothetical protein
MAAVQPETWLRALITTTTTTTTTNNNNNNTSFMRDFQASVAKMIRGTQFSTLLLYFLFCSSWRSSPKWAWATSLSRFHDHTQTHHTT